MLASSNYDHANFILERFSLQYKEQYRLLGGLYDEVYQEPVKECSFL
jgi:hypothetical protein